MTIQAQRISFPGSQGAILSARLDLPAGPVRAYALFAHCFTCSKDIFAAARIAGGLAAHGIAVLRFDFTGLGMSEGEFANTNFSSNVDDLIAAAGYLRDHFAAPGILIGHSLGGAAVLVAAHDIPEVKAVVTLGAPADARHVIENFAADVGQIEQTGEAKVSLAGRDFTIRKQFLDDLRGQSLAGHVAGLKRALLVMHAPLDKTVGIGNAADIFAAARHPKSFVSLDSADHLLSRREDAIYAADIISAWASRFVGKEPGFDTGGENAVLVAETGEGTFQQHIVSGRHRLIADEPESYGGLGTGPSPYDFLSMALGACTSMTLRLYASQKKLPLQKISTRVTHDKVHAADSAECESREGRLDRFERVIEIEGDLDDAQRARLVEIAGKCPVHRTLEHSSIVVTRLKD